QCRTDKVFLRCAACQTEYRTPHLTIPIWCSKSDKCRYNIHAIRIFYTGCICVTFSRFPEHTKPVTKPLYRRTGYKDTAFKRICHSSVIAPSDRCKQAMLGFHCFLPCTHQHETTGTVSIF